MLWNRQYRVKFPDLNLEFANTLRITFDITKDLSKETNKGKLVIYNLSDDTRKKIEVPDTKVEIYAGYKDNGGPVRRVGHQQLDERRQQGCRDRTQPVRWPEGYP